MSIEPHRLMYRMPVVLALLVLAALPLGCTRVSDNATNAAAPATTKTVTLYCALDRDYAEGIVRDFETASGLTVQLVTDDELTKTTGLVNRVIAKRERQECDVFWNNEIAQTLLLTKQGLTTPYKSPSAADIPDAYKDPAGHWAGFAARARIIIVNTEKLTKAFPDRADWPTSVKDLIAPRFKGKACLAKPLFGTTATHGAALFAAWGAEKAQRFFNAVRANDVAILSSNGATMRAVSSGEFLWGLTDTDDANVAIIQEKPVEIIYPDNTPDGLGVLVLPNTVALIAGGPNPAGGKRLIDFLLAPGIEEQLAKSRSAQIPVRAGVPAPGNVVRLTDIKRMDVTWDAIGAAFPEAARWFADDFLGQ